MNDAPLTPEQREVIRQQARARAVRMGLASETPPGRDPRAACEAILGSLANQPAALPGLLATGLLVGEKASAARRLLTYLAAGQDTTNPPKDAA